MLKYKIIIYVFLFMISFFSKTTSNDSKNFFDFKINLINGSEINLSKFKGKSFLLVNVASQCGFTKQYDDLQKLHELYKDRGLVILGIPSNQFGGQEPGSESEIKEFCENNFNITFPMTIKYNVKGKDAHPIYQWANKTYGKSTIPKWNFHKILINKKGEVEDTFVSFTKPMSKKIINKIEEIL